MLATTDHEAPALVRPDLDAGTRLGDRYRLIGRLGAGGGGTVWRAFDEKVAEELALKLVEADADVERWRREVALARRISHPNVCRVYDLGEADGRRWVTMELVGGDSLRRVLERGVPAAERERLMLQLVDAVAAIHATGVVHRDLKPENVVVDGRGRAVIVDFGLAKTPELRDAAVMPGERGRGEHADPRVTREGAILGTPRYMAPEQAEGRVADARSDVYALGLVLHEIASGGAPGSSEATTVAGGAAAPRAVLPPIGGPWGPVISRCCAEAPADRYADAAAVRAAIAAPRRRSRRGAAIAAAAIAVLGGGAAAAWMLARGDERAARWQPGEVTVRRLTASAPDRQPTTVVLSPDGKRLAYTVHDELYLRDVDGGAPVAVALPRNKYGHPIARIVFAIGWARDGRIAVLVLDRDDAWGVYLVDAGGAAPGSTPLYQTSLRPTAALSPDGTRLAIAVRDRGVLLVPTDGGAASRLTTTSAGEMVGGLAWSPDGKELALVRYPSDSSGDTLELVSADGSETRVLVRGRFANMFDQFVGWTAPDRIVYGATVLGGGAELQALRLRGGERDGDAVTVMRLPGEYISVGSVGGGRIALMRGTARYQVFVGRMSDRRHIGDLEPALAGGTPARRLAGWTPAGGIVFAIASAAGDHDVVERAADGTVRALVGGPADDLPDTIVDGAVLYHRGTAAALEVWRHDPGDGGAPGRDLHLTTITSDAAAANVVRCAGDRTAPCVIEEVQGDEAIYSRFDPATGARGDVVHRSRLTTRFNRSMAVSPDGAHLALVDNTSTVTTIALGGGQVTQREVRRGAELQSVTWSADGTRMWITAFGGGRKLFNLFRLDRDETRASVEEDDDIRWFWRPQESPDGKQIAIQGRDIVLDIWLVDGL